MFVSNFQSVFSINEPDAWMTQWMSEITLMDSKTPLELLRKKEKCITVMT